MSRYRFEFYMFEPITLIPSSLLTVSWRAIRQFFYLPLKEQQLEILFQRRIGQLALQMIAKLLFIPLLANFLATFFIFTPVVEQLWHNQSDIYLHTYLETQAFQEFQDYENELYLDFFLNPELYDPELYEFSDSNLDHTTQAKQLTEFNLNPSFYQQIIWPGQGLPIQEKLQQKMMELASKYNQKSMITLIRLFGDGLTLFVFFSIAYTSGAQLFLLKAVVLEMLASLHDITRSVMIIFSVNLLVGYHSPRGWELLLQWLIDRGNWPLGETFILFVVGTLPVILDTCFKYWIFRYLNKSLPTTVVTYHRMIE
jgi:hypothetical protein